MAKPTKERSSADVRVELFVACTAVAWRTFPKQSCNRLSLGLGCRDEAGAGLYGAGWNVITVLIGVAVLLTRSEVTCST
jgi:hypothetical protein